MAVSELQTLLLPREPKSLMRLRVPFLLLPFFAHAPRVFHGDFPWIPGLEINSRRMDRLI